MTDPQTLFNLLVGWVLNSLRDITEQPDQFNVIWPISP